MKTIPLTNGRDTLAISTYVMGTGFFNTRCSIPESLEILDYYYAHGGRCIDTARYYGMFDTGKSQSELVVGRWLRETGLRREIVLCTKGGHPNVDTTRLGNPNGYVKTHSRLTRTELYSDMEQTLEALGVDSVDVYWLHRDEPDVPVEEIMPVLNEFVQKGYTKMLGASNWSVQRISDANAFAKANGMEPFSASQLQWSLALNTDKTLFDDTSTYLNRGDPDYFWYRQRNMPVFAFSSQAGGLFSRALSKDPGKGLQNLRKIRASFLEEPENYRRIQRVGQLSQETGLSPAEICTSYLLSIDFPVVAMLGCRSMEQLRDSLGAHIGYTFDQQTVAWLETGVRPE